MADQIPNGSQGPDRISRSLAEVDEALARIETELAALIEKVRGPDRPTQPGPLRSNASDLASEHKPGRPQPQGDSRFPGLHEDQQREVDQQNTPKSGRGER